ncbi:uncharacterized protein [Rutidosis leptorrhynchoides]|uniref:uncharacterized protein n=1 Tax=Rutidosis leptorrhynchoides TaxID=125765 RepID=UPI003A99CB61
MLKMSSLIVSQKCLMNLKENPSGPGALSQPQDQTASLISSFVKVELKKEELIAESCFKLLLGETTVAHPTGLNFKSDLVADRFHEGNWLWFWRREPRGGIELVSFLQLSDLLQSVSISTNEDVWVWNNNPSHSFTVAEARYLIDQHSLASFNHPTVWHSLYPVKINIFIWRLKMHRLATKDKLAVKGISLPNLSCVWCDAHHETEFHVFVDCEISRQVWAKIGLWVNINIPTWQTMDEMLQWLDNSPLHEKKRLVVFSILFSPLWNIWRLRNCYIFEDPSFRIVHVLDNIIVTSFFWLFSRYKKTRINWSVWLQNPLDSL